VSFSFWHLISKEYPIAASAVFSTLSEGAKGSAKWEQPSTLTLETSSFTTFLLLLIASWAGTGRHKESRDTEMSS
jgi:hypothetical protein